MNICIFCSSSKVLEQDYYNKSIEIADKLSLFDNNTLIYGSGAIGIMGEVSRVFKKNGRKIIGIIPEKLNVDGVASDYDNEQIITKNMHLRKDKMRELSDAYVALPGGFGTLDELLEIITLKQLQYHFKPIVIYNINGFYNDLISMFNKIFNEKFANSKFREIIFITENANEAINYLKNYKTPFKFDKFE